MKFFKAAGLKNRSLLGRLRFCDQWVQSLEGPQIPTCQYQQVTIVINNFSGQNSITNFWLTEKYPKFEYFLDMNHFNYLKVVCIAKYIVKDSLLFK